MLYLGSDMTSEGLWDMFEGDCADKCTKKCPLTAMGVHAEIWFQLSLPCFQIIIYKYLDQGISASNIFHQIVDPVSLISFTEV